MPPQKLTLEDTTTGAQAEVLVGYGFNLFSFRPMVHDRPVEVLWSAPDFEAGEAAPSHSGIPILFPFPGRVRGRSVRFGGESFELRDVPDDGRGNAIHGFVLDRPWRVLEQSAQRVVGEFHASQDDPAVLEQWPADFRIRVTYELAGNRLRSQVDVDNPGERPLPFGLGMHPYFRMQLGPTTACDDCRITVPVTEYWELVEMLPSGKRLPAEGSRGLAHGLAFAEAKLDDVFTGLKFGDRWATCRIVDPHNIGTLSVCFDRAFRECVVYTPPHRQAICIEPYTCVPDPLALAEQGIDSGLRVLGPGESFRGNVEIHVGPA